MWSRTVVNLIFCFFSGVILRAPPTQFMAHCLYSWLILDGRTVKGPCARGRAPRWIRACCCDPSCCKCPMSGAALERRPPGDQHNSWQASFRRTAAHGLAATVGSTPAGHVWTRTCVCRHSCVPRAARLFGLPRAWFSAPSIQRDPWCTVRCPDTW